MTTTKKFLAFAVPILLTIGIVHQIRLRKEAKIEYKKFNESIINGIFQNKPRGESGATYFRVNDIVYDSPRQGHNGQY